MTLPAGAHHYFETCFDPEQPGFVDRWCYASEMAKRLKIRGMENHRAHRHRHAVAWALMQVGVARSISEALFIAIKTQGARPQMSAYWATWETLNGMGLDPETATPEQLKTRMDIKEGW